MTEEEFSEVPKSLVIQRHSLSKDLKSLKENLRELMYPFTAKHFKE